MLDLLLVVTFIQDLNCLNMAENTEAEETPKRIVAIGIDGSDNSKEAFRCKFKHFLRVQHYILKYITLQLATSSLFDSKLSNITR